MSTTYFNSQANYLKRHLAVATTMLGPNTSQYTGYIFQRTTTIAHGLGYVPMYRVYYEPFADGLVSPPVSGQLNQYVTNSDGLKGPGLLPWADSTNLYIKLYFQDATLAANSFPIYYVIYKDFTL